MATAFTHAIVGSALGVFRPAEVPRRRLLVTLAVLAVLPDLDVVAFDLDIPYEHWLGHRGLTHSLPFALAAGLATAAVLFPEVPRLSARWWGLALLLASACASHGLLDALTDGGLGVGFFVPIDDSRMYLPWRPLPTSPIGWGFFMRGTAMQILAREGLLVVAPVLLAAAALAAARRRSRARGSTPERGGSAVEPEAR